MMTLKICLIAALLTENNFPSKSPPEVYQTHNCKLRTEIIAGSICDAYEYAEKKNSKLLEIMKLRLQIGPLIFNCCDRGDGRVQTICCCSG